MAPMHPVIHVIPTFGTFRIVIAVGSGMSTWMLNSSVAAMATTSVTVSAATTA